MGPTTRNEMNQPQEIITIAEALKRGYTYAGVPGEERVKRIDRLRAEHVSTPHFAVCDEPYPYQISDDLIISLLQEHFENQDTVYDDDGSLTELAGTVDFEPITQAVNAALSKKLFYPLTDIYLGPEP